MRLDARLLPPRCGRRFDPPVTGLHYSSQADDPGKRAASHAFSECEAYGTGPKEGSKLRRTAFSAGLDRRACTLALVHGAYTAAHLLAGTFLPLLLLRAAPHLPPIGVSRGPHAAL